MKQSLSVNTTAKSAVDDYVDSIAVPAYRTAAVEARRNAVGPQRRDARPIWSTATAAVAAIALVGFAPTVVGQVQRAMQAFTVVNGRTAELRVQPVSFEQLRGDMPFAVLRPAYVPAGYHEEINEIGAGTNTARAMFHYSAGDRLPALTVVESSAADQSPSKFRVEYSTRGNMPAQPPPNFGSQTPLGPGEHIMLKTVRNGVASSLKVTPITWVTHGTRVTVIAIPGAFTRMQLNAILRSMK